jgi:hypothetical protein
VFPAPWSQSDGGERLAATRLTIKIERDIYAKRYPVLLVEMEILQKHCDTVEANRTWLESEVERLKAASGLE